MSKLTNTILQTPSENPSVGFLLNQPLHTSFPHFHNTAQREKKIAASTTYKTFHLFPKLTQELQDNIWAEAAVPYARNIVITVAKNVTDNEVSPKFYFKAVTPPPGILHACHDSRVEALKTYTYKMLKVVDKNGDIQRIVYANPALDRVFITLDFMDVGRIYNLINTHSFLPPLKSESIKNDHEMVRLQPYDRQREQFSICWVGKAEMSRWPATFMIRATQPGPKYDRYGTPIA